MSAASNAALRARRREAGEPTENPEAVRARAAAYRDRQREALGKSKRRVGRAPRKLRPMMGIDGEGCGTDRKGRQHYMLMCAGNADVSYELYTGKPLSTYECLEFITSLPPREDALLCGFAFRYDVTMILRDLPSDKWEDLMAPKGEDAIDETSPAARYVKRRARYTWYWPKPPKGRPPMMFGLQYLPGNHFIVCRMEPVKLTNATDTTPATLTWETARPVPGSSRTIYETFGFFQRKFARALQDFNAGTKAERRMIARNKAERAVFSRMTREVRDYCALECELLADMMETFRANCLSAGITPRTWNGPGKLAESLHKQRGTMPRAKLDDWVPDGLLLMAEAAYYGGRFELPRIGLIPGPVYEYDINSAYPSAMQSLPCLEHGTWRYYDGEEIRRLHCTDPTALYVASVAYQHAYTGTPCKGMCGLPHRQTGKELRSRSGYAGVLAWPLQGSGTYWSVEIRSAEKLGAKLRFGPGWVYSTTCNCRPFDWIEPLYLERKRLEAERPGSGYPMKLAINSLYGKLAQTKGNPRFANPIWAGLITAQTRARLNEAIAQAPRSIVMIATDGLYSTEKLDLPIGGNLGQWGIETHAAGLMTVQPGLWWPLARAAKPKTRGISAGFFTLPRRRRFQTLWARWHELSTAAGIPWEQARQLLRPPDVDVPIRLFVGRSLAEARGKPETAGMWLDTHKTIAFDWHGKRGNHQWLAGPHVRTHPLAGGPDWVSASYDAEPLMWDLGEMAGEDFEEEQPDKHLWLDEDD